jgi:hypothetical protein
MKANTVYSFYAANFSFAQLAKRKSLGRSKPATIPKHKHCNTLCALSTNQTTVYILWNVFRKRSF